MESAEKVRLDRRSQRPAAERDPRRPVARASVDKLPGGLAQRKRADGSGHGSPAAELHRSPRQVAQRARLGSIFGGAARREGGSERIGNTENQATGPVQRVLKDPDDAGREAQLVRGYHADEDAGDACSITSTSADVHRAAIEHYRSAIRGRRAAGKLHTGTDHGHLLAIGTLQDKIATRNRKIRELTEPRPARARAEAPAAASAEPPAPIGTADQASWLTGVSAWEPRKKGT